MANEWDLVSIDNLAERVSVGHVGPTSEFFCESDEGVPLVRSQNVRPGKLTLTDVKYITYNFHEKLKKSNIKGGDILVVRVGQNRGDCCIVPYDMGELNCANVVLIKPNRIIPKFLELFLRSPMGQHKLLSISTGSAQEVLNTKSIAELLIPVPPLPEQKAIAHILGSLDDKIELNRQMNETLEVMAQALFKSWFVDFDPVIDNALAAGNAIPDELLERAELRKTIEKKDNSDIQGLFPDEFEFTEEMGWIPRGWGVDSIENLIEINPKITLKKGTFAPHADMKALPESGYSIDGVIEKAYSGGTKFENRDVLFARITPCLENGKTGLVDFLKPKEVGFGSTEFIVLREKDDIKMEFVACLARNSKFRLHAQQSMVGSSGRQRVQNACFSSFYLALPKDDGKLLKLFNETNAVNFDKISILANECQTLAKIRDTLLPKLMSGELRIPNAETLVDEAL